MSLTLEQWEIQHLIRKEQKVTSQMFKNHSRFEIERLMDKHARIIARLQAKVGTN